MKTFSEDIFLNFHTHLSPMSEQESSILNVIAGEENIPEDGYFSVGIHPMFFDEKNAKERLSFVEKNCSNERCLFIGEIGLDRRSTESMELQREVFEKQIQFAEQNKKPIVIHCVKAFSELIALKKKLKPSVPMIVHGFNNNLEVHKLLVENDFYFSFGTAILHHDSNAAQAILNTPIQRFFLENDDKNFDIRLIYDAASHHLNRSVNQIKMLIINNLWTILNSDQFTTKS